MTGELGNLFWSEKEFTDKELSLLLNLTSKELSPILSKLDDSKLDYILDYLILNSYQDKELLLRVFKSKKTIILSIESSLEIINLLIVHGEVALAKDQLKRVYKKITEKNLLNKIKRVTDLRQKYFPLTIDFIFLEIVFYLENMMNSEAVELIEEVEALFEKSWRKLDKTKTKEEYQKIINDLYKYYQESDYRFYKKFLLSKNEYTKKEKTQLLLLAAYERTLLDSIFSKLSQEQQNLIVTKLDYKPVKRIRSKLKNHVAKEENPEIDYQLESQYKRISETERIKLVSTYSLEEKTIDDEAYIISLIKLGYFDENENINDLIYGFYNIQYFKAATALVDYYENSVNKLTLAELHRSAGNITDAKILAMDVIESEEENLELIEWAKRVCEISE